ncbi:formyltransferase family protein [Pseudomonadales bacterium]|nr:formyltransferase family protein [Pseudomonadales bacterium]
MRIVIITQDDPFYLAKNIDYLIKNLPSNTVIAGCVITSVSPFGKKESFVKKALKTFNIFGLRFFLRYSIRYVFAMATKENKVASVLKKYNIPRIELTCSINSAESLKRIKNYFPDLLISIGGNEIFRKPLIELAENGCLNLHTAPLPKYRGLMPSFWVLKHQEKYTAVSVFYVDEGIDSGPILVQEQIEIKGQSQEQLISQTKKTGMNCILKAISKIQANDISTIPNDDNQMTYYSFPTKDDVREFRRIGARFF